MRITGPQMRVLEQLAAGEKPDTKNVPMMPLFNAGLVDDVGHWILTQKGHDFTTPPRT